MLRNVLEGLARSLTILAAVTIVGEDLHAQASGCNALWNIKWFGCDRGHDNDFTLLPDGTPVCGSGNCPGSPGSCWGPTVTQSSMSGQVTWTITGTGSLSMNHAQDYQVYGDTFLFVSTPKSLSVPYDADAGSVWLNGTKINGSPLALPLAAGWNHLEWTCYNQNQGGHLNMTYAFTNHVDAMSSSMVDSDGDGLADCLDNCASMFNPDQADCDGDGIGDICAISMGLVEDCNGNGIPDDCEIADGSLTDCNANGVPDACDIAAGTSLDLDGDTWPDECQGTWLDLGHALAGTNGLPFLDGEGRLIGGTTATVTLTNGLAGAQSYIVLGLTAINSPFKGGVMVPMPDLVSPPFALDAGGGFVIAFAWPDGLASGTTFYLQVWIMDPAGPLGWSSSNGLASISL